MATLRTLLKSLQAKVEAAYAWATRSWLPAMLVIFGTFALASRLLDDYPILPDGLRSIATAGGLDAASDLGSVFDKLTDVSQQHVPGYFLALFAWGKITAWEPLLLRSLSLYFGILSLALMYRLGKDFISPQAGLYSLLMLVSLSFYNLWYLPIRMYSLFAATGLWLLWLYLRAVIHNKASPRHYILLFLAGSAFLYSQIFSLALCLGLAAYHLLFVGKSRHWLFVAAAGALAGLTILPWLSTILTGTAEIVGGEFGDIRVLSPVETVTTILSLSMNANMLFLGLLALSARAVFNRADLNQGVFNRSVIKYEPLSLALWTILILASAFYALVNQATGAIDLHRSRYFLALCPVIILLLNIGLVQLKQLKQLQRLLRWELLCMGILLFWIASGLLYQRRVGAELFVRSYNTLPIHLVERHLRQELAAGDLLAGWSGGLSFAYRTPYGGLSDYYFAAHSIDIAIEHTYALGQLSDEQISAALARQFADYNRIWLSYEVDNSTRYHRLYHVALTRQHDRCFRDRTLATVSIDLYQRAGCD